MKHPALVALDAAAATWERASRAARLDPSPAALNAKAAARAAFFSAHDAAERAGVVPTDHPARSNNPGAPK